MCRGFARSNKTLNDEKAIVLNDGSLKTLRTCSSSSSSFSFDDEPRVKRSCLKVKTQTESLKKKISTSTGDCSVVFSTLEIRSYPLRLGDNPSISSGPPLTMSWRPEGVPLVVEVEDYEDTRPTRRPKDALRVSKLVRQEWLRKEDYSRGEMMEAQAKALRIQRGRLASAKESLNLSKSKDFIKRKFKKYVLHTPSDKELYEEWKEQSLESQLLTNQVISCST